MPELHYSKMISVIIPLYNKETLISKTIQSVLSQSYSDYEVIVINDGSSDNSVNVVEAFHSEKIRIISQKNAGVSAARNRGIEEAQGEYVAFLDADDEWSPDYLENQMSLAHQFPECDVVAHSYVFCRNGAMVHPRLNGVPFSGDEGVLENYFKVSCLSDPPISTISVMVKRCAIKKVGGFPVGIKSGEDLLVWARLALQFKIAYCLHPLAVYNQGYSNPRPPETVDRVGLELEQLHKAYPKVIYLDRYVAFWYKMRMCRCIAHRMWKQAIQAFFKSLRYNPLQWKIYLSVIKYLIN